MLSGAVAVERAEHISIHSYGRHLCHYLRRLYVCMWNIAQYIIIIYLFNNNIVLVHIVVSLVCFEHLSWNYFMWGERKHNIIIDGKRTAACRYYTTYTDLQGTIWYRFTENDAEPLWAPEGGIIEFDWLLTTVVAVDGTR